MFFSYYFLKDRNKNNRQKNHRSIDSCTHIFEIKMTEDIAYLRRQQNYTELCPLNIGKPGKILNQTDGLNHDLLLLDMSTFSIIAWKKLHSSFETN